MKVALEGSWRRRLARLALCLIVCSVLYVLVSPASTDVDQSVIYSSSFELGERNMMLSQQIDAINRGNYLVRENGVSFTRNATEDIGHSIFLANLALIRNILGLGPMSWSDVHRIRGVMAAASIAVLFLWGAPLGALLAMALLTWLFTSPLLGLNAERVWPQIMAVGFCFVLLEGLTREIERRDHPYRGILALFGVGVFAGSLGLFRSEARHIALLPFAAILATHTVALALWLFSGSSDAVGFDPGEDGSERAAGWKQRFRIRAGTAAQRLRALPARVVSMDRGLRGVVASAAAVAGILAVSPLAHLNLELFERIEGVDHHPDVGKHILWHPLFLGLGWYWRSPENVAWHDNVGRLEAERTNGYFSSFGLDTEEAERRRYFDILTHNTPLFVDVYLRKAREILYDQTSRPVALAVAIAFFIALFGVTRLRNKSGLDGSTLTIGTVAMGFSALAPGLVAGPAFAVAFNAVLAGIILFGGRSILRQMESTDVELSAADRAHLRRMHKGLLAAAVVGALLAILLFARVASINEHRIELAARLEQGELGFDALLGEYHSDAVLAFNSLRLSTREKIAKAVVAEYGAGLPPSVRRTHTSAKLKILHVRRTQQTLYLLVQTSTALKFESVIPVRMELAARESVPRPAGADFSAFFHTNSDLIFIPKHTVPGVWLFATRAPKDTVERLVIGDLVRYFPVLYTKQIENIR